MIQSPNPYNPMRHPDRAQARRNSVLRAMNDEGFISADDLNEAPFTERGGVDGALRDLGDKAADYVERLNEELTA